MRATGIIRRIDELGRVVIPKEVRRTLGIKEGDPLEIYTEGKAVCFKKHSLIEEYVPMAEALIETLINKGVECALYDNSDCKVCGDKQAPVQLEYDAFCSNHYAITVDGEFCGFLATAAEHTTATNFISFVISAMEKIMAMD